MNRFSELGQLPGALQLETLNEGCVIEAAMVTNNALCPQVCKLKYNNTLQSAEERTCMTEGENNDAPDACKHTRCHSRSSSTEKAQEAQVLFCRQLAGSDGVHGVATFQMDSNVREVLNIVFAELVLYIEEARLDEDTAQVFKLANLVELYHSRMQQLGVELETKVHSTWLKQRLLAQFPDMRTHKGERRPTGI